jgi:hypothetical protein
MVQAEFLSGALFATESSRHIVPCLQHAVQADGAHTSFGKYMLFSAYATTANGNMSPLAFGLLFGNEVTKIVHVGDFILLLLRLYLYIFRAFIYGFRYTWGQGRNFHFFET